MELPPFNEKLDLIKICIPNSVNTGESPHTSSTASPRSDSSMVAHCGTIKVSKHRWLVLLSYCLLTTSAGSAWLCFPAVSNILQKYYGIGILAVNFLSIVFGIAIVLLSIPFAVLLDKWGLSVIMKLSAFINTVGATVRYFGYRQDQGYWLLLTGNIFTSISVAGFLFLPGKIALTWFSIKEIGKATSICIAFDALGTGLGFLHATCMIRNEADASVVTKDIQSFLLSQLIPSVAVFLFTMMFVKRQPKYPPNMIELRLQAQEEGIEEPGGQFLSNEKHNFDGEEIETALKENRKQTLRYSIFELLKNFQFHLIILLQGIAASIEGIYEILLNEMLIRQYPGSERIIGLLGFLAVIFGFVSNIVVGAVIDKTPSFRMISFVVFLVTSVFCAVWCVLMQFVRNFIAIAVVFCILMATNTSYYTVAFAHSANVAVTAISPAATGVLLVLTSQVYDTFTAFVATEIFNAFGALGVNAVAVLISILATVLSLLIKDQSTSLRTS